MANKTHSAVAKEGWPVITLVSMAGLITLFAQQYAIAGALFVFAVLLSIYYRDPRPRIPAIPLAIVSPIDGEVLFVGKGRDPFLERDALQIVINKAVFGVVSIRSPIEGKLVEQYAPKSGRFPDNRGVACIIETDESDFIIWQQYRGLVVPKYYVQPGERLGQGQRCAFQPLTGKTVLYLPVTSRASIAAGDKVKSGETQLALLIHQICPPNASIEKEFATSAEPE
jgi:phosphatidylserine decarboxylase